MAAILGMSQDNKQDELPVPCGPSAFPGMFPQIAPGSMAELCANASCRRARSCRGRAYLCARRNFPAAPEGVRDFFAAFLAAKSAGLPLNSFPSEMEQSEEFMALSAWRRAAEASPR